MLMKPAILADTWPYPAAAVNNLVYAMALAFAAFQSLDRRRFRRDNLYSVGSVTAATLSRQEKPMADVKITVLKNGPYIVTGGVELKDADGKSYPSQDRVALCRCGASTKKPFCDGTHSKIGFQAAEQAVPGSAER